MWKKKFRKHCGKNFFKVLKKKVYVESARAQKKKKSARVEVDYGSALQFEHY